MDKRIFKKTAEELQEFLQFRRRGSKVRSKKGKGSFSRKEKHKNKDMRD
jgi:stalled ribosome alternative rescue factor ArfA